MLTSPIVEDATSLERALRDAADREDQVRLKLGRQRTLAAKLRAYARRVREVLREPWRPGRFEDLMREVAAISAEALEVPRASVWLFDTEREHLLRRIALPEDSSSVETTRLSVEGCRQYVAALSNAEVSAVAVDDAVLDPRTRGLAVYLAETGVTALLDVPVVAPGELRGVLCHEHRGGPRAWQEEEIDFANDVGLLVALALEVERRDVAERSLRHSEARYRTLVEWLPAVVYSFDVRTRELDYLSPNVHGLADRPVEDFLAPGGVKHWIEAIYPDDRAPVVRRLMRHIEEPYDEELVYRVRGPGGKRLYVRDRCTVVKSPRGAPIAVQGTLTDITAQRESEIARTATEAHVRALIGSADLPAASFDATGRVEVVSDRALELAGRTRTEVLGATIADLVAPDDASVEQRRALLDAILAGESLARFPLRKSPNGGAEVQWAVSLSREADGALRGGACLGVERRAAPTGSPPSDEVERLEGLGRLAAWVAHDFNNLLTIIRSAVELLTTDEGSHHDAEMLDEMRVAVEQGVALARTLLASTRREPAAPTRLDASAFVETSMPMVRNLARGRARLETRFESKGTRVFVDPSQLRQILMNLIVNACAAIAGHGSRITIATSSARIGDDEARAAGLEAGGTFWVLEVADDGRGMNAEDARRAFDPFFTTKKSEGTGLGLAMCKTFATRAGGFIRLDTEPGRGASFRVCLPVCE